MFAEAPSSLSDLARGLLELGASRRRSLQRWALPRLDRLSARVRADLPWAEELLTRLDPTLSLRVVRARVTSIQDETPDTKTYWLRPNARFGSFAAGSYVNLRVVVDGRALVRSYSLSSPPRADGALSITVKRVPGGVVSNWLADTLRPGHVLELSPATGQFVLPVEPPPRLLFLSAGSGITPVMSMLRKLTAADASCSSVLLHFARSQRDIIFRHELESLARSHPGLRVAFCVEETPNVDAAAPWHVAQGRFRQALLEQLAPDFRELDTYLCGPAGFMREVMQTFERAGADLSRLRYERFNAELDVGGWLDHAHVIRFLRSATESISTKPRTILEAAEAAGLQVAYGCRAGNCGTCRCRKARGVVVDITTGLASSSDEGFIYPCISMAQGTVEVEL